MTPLQEQRPVTANVFTQRYSATRRGAALARRLALWQLDAWGIPYDTSLSDTVALLVAELAANAALHGRVPGRDFELRLVHTSETGVVRVEVSDTHDARPDPLLVSQPDADADGGRGLLIVDAVATSWGVRDRVGPGKTVWAEAATTLPAAPGTD